MSGQDYFKNALSDFTFEVASGGAIRHLADLGYTVAQITERLAFPTSYERVRQTVWKHLLDTGVLCLEEPGSGGKREAFDYVREYGPYGKASFRRVPVSGGAGPEPACWKQRTFSRERDGTFADFLSGKCRENGQEHAYISCDFGINAEAAFAALDQRQLEYIRGIPWPERVIYHRLDRRMLEIVVRLYENACYCGTCCFLKTGEKVHVDSMGHGTI